MNHKTLIDIHTSCERCDTNSCLVKNYCTHSFEYLNQNKKILYFKKGQTIFVERSPINGIFFIKKGNVIIVSSNSVKEEIVRLASDGYIIGRYTHTNESHSTSAICLSNSEICFFNNNTIERLFTTNTKLGISIMSYYADELQKCELRLKYFAFMSVRERVAFALNYIAETFGINNKDHTLNGVRSRRIIAELAGTNIEQVSRVISFFKNEGIVGIKGKAITIKNLHSIREIILPYSSVFSGI